MRLLTLGFLLFYVGLLIFWMVRTPAFNGNLRLVSANGEVILENNTTAMYDQAHYLFAVAYGYVFPDVTALLDENALESLEEMQLNAEIGLQLLEESVSLSPQDAHSWMVLAWARALSGREADDVLHALRRSWELAPHDRILADRRLSLLVTTLADIPDAELLLNDADRAAVEADKATLTRFEPSTLSAIGDIAPDAAILE